jgi:hypothetical protein
MQTASTYNKNYGDKLDLQQVVVVRLPQTIFRRAGRVAGAEVPATRTQHVDEDVEEQPTFRYYYSLH